MTEQSRIEMHAAELDGNPAMHQILADMKADTVRAFQAIPAGFEGDELRFRYQTILNLVDDFGVRLKRYAMAGKFEAEEQKPAERKRLWAVF